MTYLEPSDSFMKLFKCNWRCQEKTLDEQLRSGCRCIDLRIRLKNNKWVFAHGKTVLKSNDDVISILNKLNAFSVMNKIKIYVRILLEEDEKNIDQEMRFIELCRTIEAKYTGILQFFEGRRKFDWKLLYNFSFYPLVVQYVGSMQKPWWGKLWPRMWWRKFNKKYEKIAESLPDDAICLFDFV